MILNRFGQRLGLNARTLVLLALVAFATSSARAVILLGTGDPEANTSCADWAARRQRLAISGSVRRFPRHRDRAASLPHGEARLGRFLHLQRHHAHPSAAVQRPV
jgi:hypothetical protein